MGQETVVIPRVVLDTNCLISALLFSQGRLAWLRHAWQSERFTPLASHPTIEELLRVLRYPKFRLTPAEQECLLAEYLPYTESVSITTLPLDSIPLNDPDDMKFIHLALIANADVLVSGDRDLLSLGDQCHGVTIMPPQQFYQWLSKP